MGHKPTTIITTMEAVPITVLEITLSITMNSVEMDRTLGSEVMDLVTPLITTGQIQIQIHRDPRNL